MEYHRWSIADLAVRLVGMIARGVVRRLDDGPKGQTVDVSLEQGLAATRVEHWQPYGVSYRPLAGAEVIVLARGGDRDTLVALAAADRRYRVHLDADGDVALHDHEGQVIKLTRDGIEIETATKPVTVTSGVRVSIAAPEIRLGDQVAITADGVTIDAGSVPLTVRSADAITVDAPEIKLGGDGADKPVLLQNGLTTIASSVLKGL